MTTNRQFLTLLKKNYIYIYICICMYIFLDDFLKCIFSGCYRQHVGSQFPAQGLKPRPLHGKCRVLTTGPPGKSQQFLNHLNTRHLLCLGCFLAQLVAPLQHCSLGGFITVSCWLYTTSFKMHSFRSRRADPLSIQLFPHKNSPKNLSDNLLGVWG